MIFNILTLFPEMFGECLNQNTLSKNNLEKTKNIYSSAFSESILKRAQDKSLIEINIFNLRDWGIGKHREVDDSPYGGGAGMVLKVNVVDNALQNIKQKTLVGQAKNKKQKTILLTPQGKIFNQQKAKSLSRHSELILICGHYEGFDERIRELVDEEISIGDYILTGGEIPAMVLVDSVSRLIPGVLGKEESIQFESFSDNLLEYPQYTRPENYKGRKVPKVLLSGNHVKIEEWRKKYSLEKTKKKRPDLLD